MKLTEVELCTPEVVRQIMPPDGLVSRTYGPWFLHMQPEVSLSCISLHWISPRLQDTSIHHQSSNHPFACLSSQTEFLTYYNHMDSDQARPTPKPPLETTPLTMTTTTPPPSSTTPTAPPENTTAPSSTNRASSDRVQPTPPPPTNTPTAPRTPANTPVATTTTRTTPIAPNPPTYQTNRTQQYIPNGPSNRPELRQPYQTSRRHHRTRLGRCCSCLLGTILFVFTFLILIAITVLVLYFVYQPEFPTFTVTNLAITRFNLTAQFSTSLNLIVSARNPNKKIQFYYDPTRVSIYSGQINIGDGNFPSYYQGTKNTTKLVAVVGSNGGTITGDEIQQLKGEIGDGLGLDLRVVMRTKVRVQIGDLRTVRFGIRVSCGEIRASKIGTLGFDVVVSDGGRCEGKWRIKIWKLKLYI